VSGAIPPLSQYAFMAWCSVKAQGQLYLFTFYIDVNKYIYVPNMVYLNSDSVVYMVLSCSNQNINKEDG
jgi:hypothetical protein